ncbi:MAG TPA: aminodeoxychorismate synthase component I [Verrucomicrobiae bacterium]|nr:aminodeoxychorismate synthase component I [Verrucomicrobiae bacterium]
MRALIETVANSPTPEACAALLQAEPGLVLLRSLLFERAQARYSILTAKPFLVFRSRGSRCEINSGGASEVHFGNPWRILDHLIAEYELLDEPDVPFPLGGCFGFWGYELKNFLEPKLSRRASPDLELPDCHLGFYSSLVIFDHRIQTTWIVATGLAPDGSRSQAQARDQIRVWQQRLACAVEPSPLSFRYRESGLTAQLSAPSTAVAPCASPICSNLTRTEFVERVKRAQAYIRAGDIYQVNLSHRLQAPYERSGWDLFVRLAEVSPAPFSAFLDCGQFELVSSSPEQFLRLSGGQIQTRPIKGTRPRASDPTRDAQLAYELQTSPKETAELVMITDLLRNDLGKVCEFGSVHVSELLRLEQYPQVQHLVSTIAGRLRADQSHFSALAACFPGGSITGAPKFRAMQIIDELEPCARGPYTGALGYLGFNRESQFSIAIRTAICHRHNVYFHVGAGIVADSDPQAEYEETLAKGAGFLAALGQDQASKLGERVTGRSQGPLYGDQ